MIETNNLSAQSTPNLLDQLCKMAAQGDFTAYTLYDILSYRFARLEAASRCIDILCRMAKEDSVLGESLVDAWCDVAKQSMEEVDRLTKSFSENKDE